MEETTNSTVHTVAFNPEGDDTSWKSDKIDKLAAALAKAQSEMKGAEKKSVNPFFNSGYADLHTVIESSFPETLQPVYRFRDPDTVAVRKK